MWRGARGGRSNLIKDCRVAVPLQTIPTECSDDLSCWVKWWWFNQRSEKFLGRRLRFVWGNYTGTVFRRGGHKAVQLVPDGDPRPLIQMHIGRYLARLPTIESNAESLGD